MATPTIQIDQVGRPAGTPGDSRSDLVLASLVTLTDPANGAGIYLWEMIARPIGSTATLTGAATDTATFTPDVAGTYLFRLTFNGVDVSGTTDAIGQFISTQGAGRVALTNGTLIPGAGETSQHNSESGLSEGWHPVRDTDLRVFDRMRQPVGGTHGSVMFLDAVGNYSAVAPGTSGYLLQSQGPGVDPTWLDPASLGGGASTLQGAYDGGASIVTAGGGPVAMSRTAADTQSVLTVDKSPSAAAAGSALAVITGANASGPAIDIQNAGSGAAAQWDSGSLLGPDGNAGAPSYGFTSATNSGMYYNSAANLISWSVLGQFKAYLGASNFRLNFDGTEGIPAFINASDTDTGVWWPAADTLAISTGSTEAVRWNASQQTLVPDGAAGTPSYSFVASSNSGLYWNTGSGRLAFSVGGAMQLEIATTFANFNNAGNVTVPGFYLVDTGSGFFRPGANLLAVSSAGTEAVRWSGAQTLMPDGNAGAPALSFAGLTTVGIYRNGNAVIFDGNTSSVSVGNSRVAIGPSGGGSETAPILVREGDNNTGFFFPDDVVAVTTGGSEAVRWNASQQTLHPDSTAAAPAISFANYVTTGIHNNNSASIYTTIAGVDRVVLDGSRARFRYAGSESAPGITFDGAAAGFWSPAVNVIAISTVSIERQRWSANGTGEPISTITLDGLGELTLPTNLDEVALLMENNTAATAVLDQTSPLLAFQTTAWDSTAVSSKDVQAFIGLAGQAGAGDSDIGGDLTFWSKIGADPYAVTAYLTEAGKLFTTYGVVVDGNAANPGLSFLDSESSGLSYSTGRVRFSHGGLTRMSYDGTDLGVGIHVLPTNDSTYDLGESATRWRNIYTDDVDASADITAAGDIDAAGGMRRSPGIFYLSSPSTSTTYTMKIDGSLAGIDALGWFVPARAGSVVELSVWADSDVGAGQIDFWVEISTDGGDTWSNSWGSSGTPIMSLDTTNDEVNAAAQAKDTSTFAAGNVLRVRAATDGSFSGGRTIFCSLGVEY